MPDWIAYGLVATPGSFESPPESSNITGDHTRTCRILQFMQASAPQNGESSPGLHLPRFACKINPQFLHLLIQKNPVNDISQKANKPSSMNRKMFLKALSNDLCLNHLKIRATMDNIPQHLKTKIQHFAGAISAVDNRPSVSKRPGRCGFCSSKKSRKTTTTCATCGIYVHFIRPMLPGIYRGANTWERENIKTHKWFMIIISTRGFIAYYDTNWLILQHMTHNFSAIMRKQNGRSTLDVPAAKVHSEVVYQVW
ncbi:hypothetical protein C0J52_15370 [Blattella germanica]|nr:hypothetical protein C0J52_15370 [Blattella germanica]